MKLLPAKVDFTDWSRNVLRNCTSEANSEPYATEAITHLWNSRGTYVSVMVVVLSRVNVLVVVAVEVVDTVGPVMVAVVVVGETMVVLVVVEAITITV